MTSRDLLSPLPGREIDLTLLHNELLPRVIGVTSRSRSALALPVVTLEHEADLPVGPLSAPPSVRVLDFDGFRLVTDAFGCGVLGRTLFVSEGDASLGDIGVHPRGEALTHMNLLLSVDLFLFDVTGQSLSKTVHDTLWRSGVDRDGHEGELDVRVAAPLHSSFDRRFRVWEDVALYFFR